MAEALVPNRIIFTQAGQLGFEYQLTKGSHTVILPGISAELMDPYGIVTSATPVVDADLVRIAINSRSGEQAVVYAAKELLRKRVYLETTSGSPLIGTLSKVEENDGKSLLLLAANNDLVIRQAEEVRTLQYRPETFSTLIDVQDEGTVIYWLPNMVVVSLDWTVAAKAARLSASVSTKVDPVLRFPTQKIAVTWQDFAEVDDPADLAAYTVTVEQGITLSRESAATLNLCRMKYDSYTMETTLRFCSFLRTTDYQKDINGAVFERAVQIRFPVAQDHNWVAGFHGVLTAGDFSGVVGSTRCFHNEDSQEVILTVGASVVVSDSRPWSKSTKIVQSPLLHRQEAGLRLRTTYREERSLTISLSSLQLAEVETFTISNLPACVEFVLDRGSFEVSPGGTGEVRIHRSHVKSGRLTLLLVNSDMNDYIRRGYYREYELVSPEGALSYQRILPVGKDLAELFPTAPDIIRAFRALEQEWEDSKRREEQTHERLSTYCGSSSNPAELATLYQLFQNPAIQESYERILGELPAIARSFIALLQAKLEDSSASAT